MRGKFVTVEGLDGAGKTTQLAGLIGLLRAQGVSVCETREPGGTTFGEKARELLLGATEPLHPEAETLLLFAARREHIARIIEPALAVGDWVVCDRFTDASYAYQAGGSGVAWEKIGTLERWTQSALQPDLTILFDVELETARERTARVRTPDRFERESVDFHRRVRDAYLRREREAGGRIRRVDASRSVEEVRAEVRRIVQGFLGPAWRPERSDGG